MLAQLTQQLGRDQRTVHRKENCGLGRDGTEPGDQADERRLRLRRLDDDGERKLELALADREPGGERLPERPPRALGEGLVTEPSQRLRRAETRRRPAHEQDARYRRIRHGSV